MSGVKDITRDLTKLDSQLDGLEEAMEPLLNNLEEMSSQLPLLDKAKLFSLTAYSIESLLFSSLKLQGADAQNHAVFTELKRIRQYFQKINTAEKPAASRSLTVNQEAAARMLKSDLGDDKNISNKLAEKIAEERAKALLKSMETKKRPAEDSAQSSAEGGTSAEPQKTKKAKKQNGKKKKSKA